MSHRFSPTEEGISEGLANYMTMVFDYGAPQIVSYFSNSTDFVLPNYLDSIHAFGEELDQILSDKNTTLLSLMQRIAINCTNFVVFCEIHGAYINPDVCCRDIFHAQPFFSREGTCFSTKQRILETSPYAFNSVRFWVDMSLTPTPGIFKCKIQLI